MFHNRERAADELATSCPQSPKLLTAILTCVTLGSNQFVLSSESNKKAFHPTCSRSLLNCSLFKQNPQTRICSNPRGCFSYAVSSPPGTCSSDHHQQPNKTSGGGESWKHCNIQCQMLQSRFQMLQSRFEDVADFCTAVRPPRPSSFLDTRCSAVGRMGELLRILVATDIHLGYGETPRPGQHAADPPPQPPRMSACQHSSTCIFAHAHTVCVLCAPHSNPTHSAGGEEEERPAVNIEKSCDACLQNAKCPPQ